jgi:iron complex transport system substrate-binding protein
LLSVLAAGCSPSPKSGVLDQVGSPVDVRAPQRLVALAPDVTEVAYAVGAGDLVIAAPATADFPPAARRLPHVEPGDVESVLAAAPDLVLATTAGNDPRVIARLRQLHVAVCTLDVTSLARLTEAAVLVGELTGRQDQARALVAGLSARIDAASRRAAPLARRRALYVVWWEPLIVAAPGTFHDDLLRAAGLVNLAPAAAGRYPRVDPEILLDPALELVVAPDEPDVRATFDTLRARPVASRLRAGATRLLWVPADLANRPGPRLVDALEALVSAREASP